MLLDTLFSFLPTLGVNLVHAIVLIRCGLAGVLARNLEPQKFLLKAWVAAPRNFAPNFLPYCTYMYVIIIPNY